MSEHLEEISAAVDPGCHAVLILDQAGWHGATALRVPGDITLLPLPARSPELNPMKKHLAVHARQLALEPCLPRLRRHRRPLLRRLEHPSELTGHRCIGLRMGTGSIYYWELERHPERLAVSTDWAVVVSETALAIELAETGGMTAFCQAGLVARQLAARTLREVLAYWGSFGPAFHV